MIDSAETVCGLFSAEYLDGVIGKFSSSFTAMLVDILCHGSTASIHHTKPGECLIVTGIVVGRYEVLQIFHKRLSLF